ncbi:MAG: dipeptide/oligopeptide/nickel ABC transporter ATP-binding protein [Anaerolineae bacterium CG03_land_8_20_14_0_80_58_20]|nr:MAG: dipeptide/oligopeptide/nickel ABC transporter ATP-binding protein [Anaerolineae bacterium CG06_land_8_20_14_3_00_57_67]PIV26620.1 MAG: dipeptide/oligopeptide/nickel ABC transporter ATP-binding protein [Anaerolineae bacterium CG03_land_8_20_14_0_80_58_20]
MPDDSLYSVRNLTVEYQTRVGIVKAVDDVSLDIRRGEILGLVGESGCGKSTLGKALMRLHTGPARIANGELWFDGRDLMKLSDREMPDVRGAEIGMIFQDPMTSLNPVQRILDHLTETIQAHEPETSGAAARTRSEELVERLGIRRERLNEYPHQMSGGMRQRVMISLALALRAKLVIADEPTTSLDVIVEAKFLDLLKELQKEFGLTILLITHNIGVVAEVADRVAVMYAAKMAEVGDVNDVFADPKHPYTQGLLKSVPNIRLEEGELYKMEGAPPNLLHPPIGCRFHPRCPFVMDICRTREPAFEPVVGGHLVSCLLYQTANVKQEGLHA